MSVYDWPSIPKSELTITGAESPMSEVEQGFVSTVRDFCEKYMRPIGVELDKMSPEAVKAEGSPYWLFREKFLELGITPSAFGDFTVEERARLIPMIFEEFGWADAGLSVTIGACQLPHGLAIEFEKLHLLEKYPWDMIGCWAITEPDHGSDSLDGNGQVFHPMGKYSRPNCMAKIEGDHLVINGQKSAWVSNGPIADICVLYCLADEGKEVDTKRGYVVIVPLDIDGVSRGKSIDKLGQRALPQGELYFDNVRVEKENIIAYPEDYLRSMYAVHTEANTQMGAIFTGTARAAYELALAYAHERKQGGVPIIKHQLVAHRLFHMARKVEASRALNRRVALFNASAPVPALHAAMMTKITATQTAFEVASDALQIFGGNGNTREYTIEKIMRDARASLIEDGCNDVLALKGGAYLFNEDLL